MKELTEIGIRKDVVGAFLRSERMNAGLTQSAVAKRLHYSSSQFVSNWERGISLPPLNIIPVLCRICSIPPKKFIGVLHAYQEKIMIFQRRQVVEVFRRHHSDVG